MRESDRVFEEFVAARQAALLRRAFLLTGDRHAAEDLMQGTLQRLYVAWPRVVHDDADRYAMRIMANLAVSRWRRHPRGEVLMSRVPDGPRELREDERLVDRARLVAALAELPPRQRAAVVLRYVEDLPEVEVAELLGCAVGTVKSQAARGLARLRSVLAAADSDNARREASDV